MICKREMCKYLNVYQNFLLFLHYNLWCLLKNAMMLVLVVPRTIMTVISRGCSPAVTDEILHNMMYYGLIDFFLVQKELNTLGLLQLQLQRREECANNCEHQREPQAYLPAEKEEIKTRKHLSKIIICLFFLVDNIRIS